MGVPKTLRRAICLVEPKPAGLHVFSGIRLPRLGTLILATLARRQGIDARVVLEEQQPLTPAACADTDVVGISTTTSTAPRAYALADDLRARGKVVILGGPHVTFCPAEALAHADYVVLGEGEPVLPGLLEDLFAGVAPAPGPGLAVRGQPVPTARAPVVADLDSLPSPDFSLLHGGLSRQWWNGKTLVPIQASRGCPFNCSFCSVTTMFGRRFRFRSVDRVLNELAPYAGPGNHVFFYDDNLAVSPRWLEELLTGFVRRGFRFSWSAQMRVDVTREPRLLALLHKTHCTNVYIGIESTNPDSLETMVKAQTAQEVARGIETFNRHQIPVHGMFVFGFDTDSPRSMEQTVDFALGSGLSTAQFLLLTPFPGTRTAGELVAQDRILFDDWGLYDAHHVVIRPRHCTPLELQRTQTEAHRRFYAPHRMARMALRGRVADTMLYAWGRGLVHRWERENRLYLDLLHLMDQSRGTIHRVDYRPSPG